MERYDIVRCKIGHINVCQTCEAWKDENVSYQFQAVDVQFLVGYLHDFFVREETAIDRLQVETMIEKGVVKEIATLLCIYGYGFELYVVKQKCTTANVVIYSDISLFYYQKFFC